MKHPERLLIILCCGKKSCRKAVLWERSGLSKTICLNEKCVDCSNLRETISFVFFCIKRVLTHTLAHFQSFYSHNSNCEMTQYFNQLYLICTPAEDRATCVLLLPWLAMSMPTGWLSAALNCHAWQSLWPTPCVRLQPCPSQLVFSGNIGSLTAKLWLTAKVIKFVSRLFLSFNLFCIASRDYTGFQGGLCLYTVEKREQVSRSDKLGDRVTSHQQDHLVTTLKSIENRLVKVKKFLTFGTTR